MNRRRFSQFLSGGLAASAVNKLFAMVGPGAPEVPVQANPARAAFDSHKRSWTLSNSFMEREMSLDPRRGLVANRLVDRKAGKNWLTAPSEEGSDVYLMIGDDFFFGPSPQAGFEYVDQASGRDPDGGTTLRIRFVLPSQKLELTLFYRCFDDSPFLEQWCRLENKSEKPISDVQRFDPLYLTLEAVPGDRRFDVRWMNGIRDYGYQRGVGEDPQPFLPYRVRKEPLRVGSQIQLVSSATGERFGRKELASTQSFSWFCLEETDQPGGLMGGLQWEGAWALNINRWSAQQIHIFGGVDKCSHVLDPGGVLESPRVFYGPYHGDLDEGLAAMHHYLRRYVMPPDPDDRFPWVYYNSWIPFLSKASETVLLLELDAAEELGIECFCLDAAWCEHMENSMEGGIGHWVEDRKKFPSGLANFSGEVHRRGMKFGLWVEPERTNNRFVGEEIPERWLSKRNSLPVGLFDTRVLCFGSPEVRAWAKQWLERVISEFNVDWLKWDLNAYNICNRPDHGHQAGDGDFMHVQGVYEVMGFLRQRFPKLVIENCSGGGNRFGYGLMRYANTSLNSDVQWPSYRARYQLIGCSYAFPPQYNLAWYVKTLSQPVKKPKEPIDENSSSTYLDYLFRSRMMGLLGISDHLAGWTPNVKKAAQKAIRDYKNLRPMLRSEVYHLLPQPTILVPPMHPPNQWEAIQYCHPGLDASVILCFRAQAPENQRALHVRGLRPDHQYRVRYQDGGRSFLASGQTLAREGIAVHLPETSSSELIWIEKG